MSALEEIRARAEAEAKIPHYRTGPGKCVCGFNAYRVGYYVYDYGEERQRHEDAAIKAGKKKATDATRLLAALDAVTEIAERHGVKSWTEEIFKAIATALEGTK